MQLNRIAIRIRQTTEGFARLSGRISTAVLFTLICGCGSETVPDLRTSYDGAGRVAVTSNGSSHVAVLGDHRFVVEDQLIRANGKMLTRFPPATTEILIKKNAAGDVSVFADGKQLVPALH